MSRFKAVFIAPRDIVLSSTISGIIEEGRCERVMMVTVSRLSLDVRLSRLSPAMSNPRLQPLLRVYTTLEDDQQLLESNIPTEISRGEHTHFYLSLCFSLSLTL